MKKTIPFALVLASISLFAAAPAFADETAPAKTAKAAPTAEKAEKGYGYKFEDDPLTTGVDGTKGFVITVRPKGARSQLLRPRASFVQEMLKSVESL
jgi:hypothetical protein